MIVNLPNIQLPEPIRQLCLSEYKNSRQSYTLIADMIQKDPFLNILVNNCFKGYLTKGGLDAMLGSLGWKGFRDRVAQAYLYYLKNGKFPNHIELTDIKELIDFERRFEHLFVQGSSRVFLLGFYLKVCNQTLASLYGVDESEAIEVPESVDRILKRSSIKDDQPDWLIFVVWSIVQVFGDKKAEELLFKNHGRYHRLIPEFEKNEHDQFIEALLRYGQAIGDESFFLYEKV